jgi:hypothetical protein
MKEASRCPSCQHGEWVRGNNVVVPGADGPVRVSMSIVGVVYLVIGLVVASGHAFLANLNAVMPIVSAVLAVLLWPLVLLGVDLHLR